MNFIEKLFATVEKLDQIIQTEDMTRNDIGQSIMKLEKIIIFYHDFSNRMVFSLKISNVVILGHMYVPTYFSLEKKSAKSKCFLTEKNYIWKRDEIVNFPSLIVFQNFIIAISILSIVLISFSTIWVKFFFIKCSSLDLMRMSLLASLA